MNIEILKKNESSIFARTEVDAKVFFSGKTPSRKELKEAIAKLLNADASLVSVRKIKNNFGHENANITAYAYKTKEEHDLLEPKHIVARHSGKKKGEGAAPAE
jgi:small subunit ribosomal protein S24e